MGVWIFWSLVCLPCPFPFYLSISAFPVCAVQESDANDYLRVNHSTSMPLVRLEQDVARGEACVEERGQCGVLGAFVLHLTSPFPLHFHTSPLLFPSPIVLSFTHPHLPLPSSSIRPLPPS